MTCGGTNNLELIIGYKHEFTDIPPMSICTLHGGHGLDFDGAITLYVLQGL
jgi:hypothetical protein